jgi:uncharacterized membrane protein
MGPMMGGSPGWDPTLIVAVILLAVVIVAVALALTFALRSAGPAGRPRPHKPGRRDRDSRPAARTGSGEDPLIIVRERYAHGEISHAEFIGVLDQLLRTRQDPLPSGAAGTAGETKAGDAEPSVRAE